MNIADHYPVMDVDSCFNIGMSGRCGFGCPVYLDGKCNVHSEMIGRITTIEELETHEEIYGQVSLAAAMTLRLKEE